MLMRLKNARRKRHIQKAIQGNVMEVIYGMASLIPSDMGPLKTRASMEYLSYL